MKSTFFFHLIVTILLSVVGCKSTNTIRKDSSVSLVLLNKSIKLPMDDGMDCVDTLFFLLENKSNDNFIFVMQDSSFCFYHHGLDPKTEFICDPMEGLAIRFMDKNSKAIEIFGYSGYHPEVIENFDLHPKEHIKILRAHSKMRLKAMVKFPNKKHFGSYYQEVPDLHLAASVDIVFAPPPFLSKVYLKYNNYSLKKNDIILDIVEVFNVPVEFICTE